MYFGTGSKAARNAKAAGASKATCSRIRTGKQNCWNPDYHNAQVLWDMPETNEPILEIISRATRKTWPELSDFDRDDLIQEIAIRLNNTPNWNPEKRSTDYHAFWVSYTIAREYKRGRGKNYMRLTHINDFARQEPSEDPEYDPYIYWDENSAQKILNEAETSSELWSIFRQMRKDQHSGRCQKCGDNENWTLHHIKPRKLGCENTIENTAGLCRTCHDEIEFVNGMLETAGDVNYQKTFRTWLKHGTEKTLRRELC